MSFISQTLIDPTPNMMRIEPSIAPKQAPKFSASLRTDADPTIASTLKSKLKNEP
jgi:hypothetical protein